MKKTSRFLLFGALMLILISAACGTPTAGTPTTEGPATLTTETPGATSTGETVTPGATSTGATTTPTTTGSTVFVPMQLVCSFCVQQIPHSIVVVPQDATVEVLTTSAGVQCNSVEMIENNQLILCQAPKLSGIVSFDLNVCSGGNCTKHQVNVIDCSAVATDTPVATATMTSTRTVTATPTTGAASPTTTVVLTATLELATATPTP